MIDEPPFSKAPSVSNSKCARPRRIACLCIALIAATGASRVAAQNHKRAWTMSDSISLMRFGDPSNHNWASGGLPIFSPDKRSFAVITERGDLACDCNIGILRIFRSQSVLDAVEARKAPPPPIRELEFRTISEDLGRALRSLEWKGNDTVIFLGGTPAPNPAAFYHDLYRLTVSTGTLENISHLAPAKELNPYVFRYVVGPKRSLLVTRQFVPPQPPHYPFEFIGPVEREGYRAGLRTGTRQDGIAFDELWLLEGTTKRKLGGALAGYPPTGALFTLPNSLPVGSSETVIDGVTSRVRPTAWNGYDLGTAYQGDRQFRVLNLETGALSPIQNAPDGLATVMGRKFSNGFRDKDSNELIYLGRQVLVADEGEYIIVNSALPLSAEHPERASTAYVLAFSAKTRKVRTLAALSDAAGYITSVTLDEAGRCVTISRRRAGTTVVESLRLEHGEWKPGRVCSIRATSTTKLDVEVEQSLNNPPHLVARAAGKELDLIPRDPSLEGVEIAPARDFTWVEPDGSKVTGRFTMPTEAGQHRVPLVIFTNWDTTGSFLPDGPFVQFNRQHLAAHGIAVLEVPVPPAKVSDTPDEGPAMVTRVDSAVAALAEADLVDPTKVGAFGFSRGGFYSRYVASFPGKVHLAAVITDDSQDTGYAADLDGISTADRFFQHQAVGVRGGRPFWLDKDMWLRTSYNFNLEKLRTPLLTSTRGGGAGVFGAIEETYAARISINAPIEHVTFPTASHQTLRPREREAWINLGLDWFRFWLQGYEDPSPAKAEMYQRWRTMRTNLAALPPVGATPKPAASLRQPSAPVNDR